MPTIQYSQSEGSFFEDARGVANEGRSTPGALLGREVKTSVCFYTELIIKASSANTGAALGRSEDVNVRNDFTHPSPLRPPLRDTHRTQGRQPGPQSNRCGIQTIIHKAFNWEIRSNVTFHVKKLAVMCITTYTTRVNSGWFVIEVRELFQGSRQDS